MKAIKLSKMLLHTLIFLLCSIYAIGNNDGEENKETTSTEPYEDLVRLDDNIYWFQIQPNNEGSSYTFTITKGKTKTGEQKDSFELKSIDLSENSKLEIFEWLLYESFFGALNQAANDTIPILSIDSSEPSTADSTGTSPNTVKNEQSIFKMRTKVYKEKALPPDALEEIELAIKKRQTAYEFDSEAFLEEIRFLTKELAPLNRQQIDSYAQKLVLENQASHELLKSQILKKGKDFLEDARIAFIPNTKRKRDNKRQEQFEEDLEVVDPQLTTDYETKGKFLNRKSVELGNQIYSLSAKSINHADNTHYVFSLSRGTNKKYFEMESLQANASTINAMAQKMKNALKGLKLERKAQLRSSDLDRIEEISRRLKRNPEDYNIDDDRFLEITIENAADQYGFSSQALREELLSTGIFEALDKRVLHSATKGLNLTTINLEGKINNGAITATKFNSDLDKTLRDVSSDFLFNAYKNSIIVEDTQYAIGEITIQEIVPIYRHGLTYGSLENEPIPAGKDKSDYYPIGAVKISKAKIEFEDEQINNIELIGKKTDGPEVYNSISGDQKQIYVEINGNVRSIQIPNLEDWVSNKAIYSKYGADSYYKDPIYFNEIYNEKGTKLGMLAIYICDFYAEFWDPNHEDRDKFSKKANDSKLNKSISFNFYAVLKTTAPSKKELTDSKLANTYLNKYFENGNPINIGVKYYLDPERKQFLDSFSIIPHVIPYTYDKIKIRPKEEYIKVEHSDSLLALGGKFLNLKEQERNLNKVYNPRTKLNYDPKTKMHILEVPMLKTKFKTNTKEREKSDFLAKETKLVFHNRYPISYSTKSDITYYRPNGKKRKEKKLFHYDNDHFILLSDAVHNEMTYYNNTENYSPEDNVLIFDNINDSKKIYKEPTTDILKARIFSDFVGFDESNPNGLIQTEVSKKFFLNTNSNSSFGNFLYSGYFNYIEPNLVIAKIEENNKYLDLKSVDFSESMMGVASDSSINYASSLDILNYSNLQIGGKIGLAYYSFPKFHIRLQFGIGGYIFQSGFAREQLETDSTFNTVIQRELEFNANSLVYFPDFRLEFNPDPRFGLEIAYRPTRVSLLSNDVVQVDNESQFLRSLGEDRPTEWVHLVQLLASIRVNQDGNGQFFFRTNFSMSGADRNSNFLQAQIGYAFNIFTRDKSLDKKQKEKPASSN